MLIEVNLPIKELHETTLTSLYQAFTLLNFPIKVAPFVNYGLVSVYISLRLCLDTFQEEQLKTRHSEESYGYAYLKIAFEVGFHIAAAELDKAVVEYLI